MSTEAPMTIEEKWQRLTNPKTLADYGLSMSVSELETFEEGRRVLKSIAIMKHASEALVLKNMRESRNEGKA